MKILLVATKSPWPPLDGGRLLLWHTIAGLAGRGTEITLVAPADAGNDVESIGRELRVLCRPLLVSFPRRMCDRTFARDLLSGTPMSISLHRLAALRERVRALLASEAFDLVHAEQLQAVANCDGPGLSASTAIEAIPLVLRSQNVESDLWRQLAAYRPALRPLLLREARRLGQWEARAVRRSNATMALTKEDTAQLAALSCEPEKVHHVPAPFPTKLASVRAPALAGTPPVVLFGGAGWLPSREGTRWFIRDIWPAVSERLPGAVLHIFGPVSSARGRVGVVAHAMPPESSVVFVAGAVLVVPLRVASGVRMKILEAWARGIPVVATPEAAQGLEAADGSELLLARDAIAFATALESLTSNRELREGLVRNARVLLGTNHEPATIAARMLAVYRQVLPQGVRQIVA
jgi:Glycosyl transferases group 1/Glycosyl transferase 4-like domain